VDALPVPGEDAGPESREAYSLKVTPGGVDVEGRSSAALYYAVQTLRQLVEGVGAAASVPEVEIHDWPSLPYRGVMIDTSHGPLPTEAEVKRQIDFLARWKNNQYFLYSEASVELKGYPLLSRDAQFSQDEVRRIVAYARERHIDVVPCMELYGHLHDLFRVERYAHLAIFPHGREFDPRKPEVAELLANWVDQLADLFPSPFFHIGLDETREAPALADTLISSGNVPPKLASPDKIEPAVLYMEQFQRVSELLRRHGKTVLVWSDMFALYPELIPRIPPGTVVVPWGYDRTVYQPYWKPFAESTLPRFIATGVSIWDQVSPNFELSFDNIDHFLEVGRPHGVLGLINTVWTDDIGVLMRPAFPGLAYGAVSAWQANPVDRGNFFSHYARIMYPPAAGEVAAGLSAISRAEVELAKAIGGEEEQTSPPYWDDPLTAAHLARAAAKRENFRQTRLLAEEAQERLSRAIQLGADDSTLSHLLLEARMLDYAGMKNLYSAEMADVWRQLGTNPKPARVEYWLISEFSTHDHSRIQDLMDTCSNLQQDYRAAWLESYTPYRLGTVMVKWDAEGQYWWRLARRFHDYAEAFHEGDALRPLESFSPGY
jgi:hexosaminidase